ncbi:hypothetical protein DPMN_135013 [Dreissena polymorpha]|uniref:Uncharacterized protein n=1 Tax=Dreissena polymorpha TaxID=45954 RepID=A0A9D4JEA5_DREPO|nr:hypothetical protein DPMN_135013 [Dreissena polymorpha]
MATADLCARKLSCVRLVEAGLEPLRRQYEIDLSLHLPAWGMLRRCSGRYVWEQRVGQGELFQSCELMKSQTSVVGLS